MTSNLLRQIVKFIIVGILNTAIDLAVLNLLIAVTQMGRRGAYYALFKAISFGVAVTNSYFIHKNWTFRGAQTSSVAAQFSEFLALSIVGAAINVGVSSLVVNYVAPFYGLEKLWPSVAALVGVVAGLFWNFAAYKFIVFRKYQSQPASSPQQPPVS